MEVHHHGHAKPQGGKNNWRHYFWEFFMLFLAVTLGFLVENQREHYVEHLREKQYIRAFIEDLKADKLNLTKAIQWGKLKCNGMDTFMAEAVKGFDFALLEDREKQTRMSIYINSPLEFHNSDGALQQLKNAGGLRLIRKQDVADSIVYYDNRLKYTSEQKTKMVDVQGNFIDLSVQIFNLNNSSGVEYLNRQLVPQAPPGSHLSKDPALWGQLINWLILYKVEALTYIGMLENLEKLAGRQISFLQKSYHLK